MRKHTAVVSILPSGSVMLNYWLLALIAIFVALQIERFVQLYYRSTRRELATITRLCSGASRWEKDLESQSRWLDFVNEAFPRASVGVGPWNRRDVLAELDDLLAGEPSLLALQRMAVAAPLIGVLTTALMFRGLEIPDAKGATLTTIMVFIRPMFFGVITGAVLAIVNQLMLHLASVRMERIRVAARGWFDRVVWGPIDPNLGSASHAMREAIFEMAGSAKSAAQLYQATAHGLEGASKRLSQAAELAHGAFDELNGRMSSFVGNLETLAKATESARKTTASLAGIARDVSPQIAEAADRFRRAVDVFSPAADEQSNAAKRFKDSTNHAAIAWAKIEQSAGSLASSCGLLGKNVEAFEGLNKSVVAAVTDHLAPSQERLGRATGEMEKAMSLFRSGVEMAVPGLVDGSTKFRDAVETRFQPAAQLQSDAAGRFDAAVGRSELALAGLGGASESITRDAERFGRASDDLSKVGESLRRSVDDTLIPSHLALRQAIEAILGLVPAMSEGLARSREGLDNLGKVIATLCESTGSLASLADARGQIERLVATLETMSRTADKFQGLSGLKNEVVALETSLIKAAAVTDAVADLPVRFQKVMQVLTSEALKLQAEELQSSLLDILKVVGRTHRDEQREANGRPPGGHARVANSENQD